MLTGDGCRNHRHDLAILGFDCGAHRWRRNPLLHHDVRRGKTRSETTSEGKSKGERKGKQRIAGTRQHSYQRRGLKHHESLERVSGQIWLLKNSEDSSQPKLKCRDLSPRLVTDQNFI